MMIIFGLMLIAGTAWLWSGFFTLIWAFFAFISIAAKGGYRDEKDWMIK